MNIDEAKNHILAAVRTIKDYDIYKMVFYTLQFIPEYFYEIPSSSSGKYHPADEISMGGLVLHTLKCIKVAEELAVLYKLSEYELDLVKAALVFHDSCKSGIEKNEGHTMFAHPLLAEKLVLDHNDLPSFDKNHRKIARKVAKLISTHMGQWNSNKYEPDLLLPLPKTKLQKFVHECDFIASRKDFKIDLNLSYN